MVDYQAIAKKHLPIYADQPKETKREKELPSMEGHRIVGYLALPNALETMYEPLYKEIRMDDSSEAT